MAGKRINLSDLADEPVLQEARIPAFADAAQRSIRLDQVAPNPLNTRDITGHPARLDEIVESMRRHGQLQPCTVVTRRSFLAVFPEFESAIGRVSYVQVTGGRRRAAAEQLGLSSLDITVKDTLAASRADFLGATAAENIDRQDLDPVEEARAVELLVHECGSGKAAAEQLGKTPPWVTQRLNLLKLIPEIQSLVRAGELPLREVRSMHQLPADGQQAALLQWKQQQEGSELTAVNEPTADEPPPVRKPSKTRLTPTVAAIQRLGATPDKIAESLRSALPPEDLRALAALLLAES